MKVKYLIILITFLLLMFTPVTVPAQELSGQSFSPGDEVSLIFDFSKEVKPQNIIEAILQLFKIAESAKYTLEASLIDPRGSEIKLDFKIIDQGGGKETIQIPQTEGLTPGIYTLKAKLIVNGKTFTKEQNFAWGVLAINSNKSLYKSGELAKLFMAVLDEKGEMVCDAQVKLQITNTKSQKTDELSTASGTIIVNPECKSKDFTLIPDYQSEYQIKDTGTYQLTLTAKTKNGTYSITDGFEVKNDAPFDIERSGPTRIYPPKTYPVRINIKANQDFKGIVKETVPADFKITQLEGVLQYQQDDKKFLQWEVDIKKGEEIVLGYQFLAPGASPQFYLLGPLKLLTSGESGPTPEVFSEKREWQIAVDAPAVIASIPRPVMSMGTEQVGGTDAHILTITAPTGFPDYKYQFLTGGQRLFIDRKGGLGWQQLISQIQTAPEYMKQQGAPGNFVWNPYGLNINTTGANVLQGFDRQNQADGSIKLVRTYSTFEEGIAESLTEEWTIPKTVEDLLAQGPKATYSMTKNRGIILTKGVNEGTWRMRWALSGIADITTNNSDIRDPNDTSWPVRFRSYSGGDFTISVNDFDNQFTTPMFSFSEVATNNKAEILFYKDGTIDTRVVDPTIIVANIGGAWVHNHQRNIFYNGTNFCVFYDKNSDDLYARCAPTVGGVSDGLDDATEQTILTNLKNATAANRGWDIYMINDSKFDLVYVDNADNTDFNVTTCTISGTTITCNSTDEAYSGNIVIDAIEHISVARTNVGVGTSERIWVATDDHVVYSANTIGDSVGIADGAWTQEGAGTSVTSNGVSLVPYESSDKVLFLGTQDANGGNFDGMIYRTCLQSDAACSGEVQLCSTNCTGPVASDFGNAYRISDTDFRFVYVEENDDVIEAQFNGTSTWTESCDIVLTGTGKNPAMMYDRITDDAYALYADSSDDIFYKKKTGASANGCAGSWGTAVGADLDEADANSLPVTQMIEPPIGSSRTSPLEFPWCYRNASTDFDVVCGNLNLAAAAATDPQVNLRGGTELRGGTQLGQ